ncbi:MAG: DUF3368 domain-containing protein [Saprospiraceae bacterium]|nr:DUF3368 domain-containing protein [Saprospiraceae bacterium]MDW8229922.1 DUF3368 domain-containing protein [Saprospiraceae bacterium]
MYGKIIITVEIAGEFGETLPSQIALREVNDPDNQRLLELHLDKGEASAIALAMGISDSKLILDDAKAREIARQLGLTYTGTLGVVVSAKLRGIIPSIKPILNKMSQAGFWLSEEMEAQALALARE